MAKKSVSPSSSSHDDRHPNNNKGKNSSDRRQDGGGHGNATSSSSGNRQSQTQSDERTPLLKRDRQPNAHGEGHDSADEDDEDDNGSIDNSSDSDEDSDDNADENTIVSNLGDFTIQPRDLSNCLSEKDVDGLFKLSDESSSSSSSDYSNKIQTFLEALQTDAKNGLSEDQYSEQGSQERIRVYGENKLPEREMKTFWRFLWEAFCDKVLIILSVAAAVSFALGMWQDFGPQHDPDEPRVNWVEGVAIMAAIVIVTVTSSVNDYSKEKQFKALSETKEIPKIDVLRDGKQYKVVQSTDLLVGDIVSIKAGDILTCDGVLLKSEHDIKVDESDATGESDSISKTALDAITGDDSGMKEDHDGESDGDDATPTPDGKSSNKGPKDKNANDGASDDKKKQQKGGKDAEEEKSDPFLLSGSKVLEGSGRFVVIAVGPRSFQGKIFMSLRSSQPDQTRMQRQLADLAETIAKLASVAGAILFLALFIRNCVELKTKPDRTPAEKGQSFLQSFVISVTLVVVAVPEGLPLAVTLALAFATNRMTQHNLLVRVFEACETMSNANVIVTDKTGTLTANEMQVVEGTVAGKRYSLRDDDGDNNHDNTNEGSAQDDNQNDGVDDGEVQTRDQLKELLKKNEALFEIWAESISINSTAFAQNDADDDDDHDKKQSDNGGKKKKTDKDKKKKREQSHQGGSNGDASHKDDHVKFVGNKTESALLHMLEVDFGDLKKKSYQEYRDDADTVQMFPFSSDRKAMATAVKLKEGGKFRLYVKGAAEAIVELCTNRANLDSGNADETTEIDDKARKDISKLIEQYASRSLRTIAMAYKDLDQWPPSGSSDGNKAKYEDVAKDLTLLAIPAIEDPLRHGVPDAVEKCHKAGVQVKMCTGDNLLTAKAIAAQCSIYDEDDKDAITISGSDWRKLSDEEKREKAPKISVMARSLPQDKQTLVKALQDVGQIVGVTGDGTNDALALKDGDVGFSMGQAGTEVAKEASDVIIMDDNFTTIVGAITWGRCVSDAVRKFLQFQLAVNITAIVITFISSVTSGEENSVMNAVQLLWVNLIMDTFAALALATDPADDSLLERQPEPRETPIMTVPMTKMIAAQALYQTTVTLTLHFVGPKALRGIDDHVTSTEFSTFVFNVFVWCQIFNMINCRRLDNKFNVFAGLHRNLWILGILAIMIGGQIMIVFIGGAAFETTPISPAYWAVSIALGAGSIVIGFLVRSIPDAPIGQLLIKIGALPNLDTLPRTRSKKETGETGDEKVHRFISTLRGKRWTAHDNIHDVKQKFHNKDQSMKSVAKGLLGQAVSGTGSRTE